MILNGTPSIFKKSCLASVIGLLCMPSAFALQQLSDDSMSETTGEGIALTLNDFKMVFQAPNDVSAGSSYYRNLENPSQYDTGFIRIIPTGENYTQLGQRGYNKVYTTVYDQKVLQGKADRNYNTQYQNSYDAKYKTEYDKLLQDYSKNITADVNAKRDTFTLDERTRYFNMSSMQAYYKQRYEDYRDGTYLSFKNDGTTKYDQTSVIWDPTGVLGLDKKAKDSALINTYEMIDLLYGVNAGIASSDLINSDFYKNFTKNNPDYERGVDVVKSAVDALIAAEIAKAQLSAKQRADYNAKQAPTDTAKAATQTIYAAIIADAERQALAAAGSAPVKSLKTKADVFLYGLALSKSDGSLSTRFSNQGFNWGSADNPWLFRSGTDKVKQFKDVERPVGYLALEAPMATVAANANDNNIKLGFWTDIFARSLDSDNYVDPATGAPTSGLEVNQRLRAQVVANGLSLNGSQVRLFQTAESDNAAYSKTLGIAALARLNTNDDPSKLSKNDADLNARGIRISTAATANEDNSIATPAMRRGAKAPIFDAQEGLYLYSPNINLVLGNMYQPFIFASEGNNIILEITRIPNVASIYNQIYQNYKNVNYRPNDPAYNTKYGLTEYLGNSNLKGSTCNVYSCGTELKGSDSDTTARYQGRNATHSSISIGTVERLPGNLLNANKGANATGIMFKSSSANGTEFKNFGSVAIDGVLIQHLKIKTTGL
jgi:hypothetical protein